MPASAEGPRSTTRVTGVIGWPVEHSLSPAIHNAAFAELGLDWVYVPMPVPPGRVLAAIEGLAALGFAGANVTMPHKTEVASAVDELTEDARRLRAVNTIVVVEGALEGHNTDAPGFDRFLRRDAAFDPAGRSVLIYGAGGAARAVALAAAQAGAREVAVAARTAARAEAVAETLEGLGVEHRWLPFDAVTAESPELVVNATPVGARGEELPLPALGPDTVVVDLLYRPATTPLQARAREAGARVHGGLGLLLHQAAISFELWTGQVPPLETMSAAAVAALAEPT